MYQADLLLAIATNEYCYLGTSFLPSCLKKARSKLTRQASLIFVAGFSL